MRIIGSRLILRDELRESDEDDMFRWLNLEEWNYYDEPDVPFKPMSRDEFDRKQEEKRNRPKSKTSHRWQMDLTSGRHIGWVNYYQFDAESRQTFVGICLPEEDTWNKGYGTEAIRLLVDHIFREMGLNVVNLATWNGNKRMIQCSLKCGFTERARMPHRAPVSVRGETLERVEFSILHSEWRPLKTERSAP